MNHIGFLYCIEWSNPYTSPPAGRPRVLAEMFVPTTGAARWPQELVALHVLGSGYSVTSRAITPPPVERTAEQKASSRRKRLARRMVQRYPLLADDMIANAIAAKPDYYLDGKSDYDERKAQRIVQEHTDIARYLANANRLLIFDDMNADIWYHQDTGGVWIAHRHSDSKVAWWYDAGLKRMIFFADSLAWLKQVINSPSLFDERVVWANSDTEAADLWNTSQL